MGGWKYNLLQCGENPVMCLWACCIPCGIACMQSTAAKYADKDNKHAPTVAFLLSCCCGCVGSIINRYRLRQKAHVTDSLIWDILSWCFCPCCSATQE